MPTFIIQARATVQDDGIVSLELRRNGQAVEMTTYRTATLEELALLILAQRIPGEPDKTFQKQITIEAHKDTGVDPDTGEPFEFWVVDDVALDQLPDEAARDGVAGLPGWATWTADQAADYIESNVVDLATAKEVLKKMAMMLVHLRGWRT